MTLEPSVLSTAPGSVIAGRLRIVRALGKGGMGAVYEVEHELTRHRRALKLLHQQMTEVPGVVERFLREASAAGRIGNPHIVETFDAGRLDSGEPYIVMELLQGKSLADKLNEKGPLDIATACDILIQTCDGVAAAHAAGIIHRDLKPENLFLVGSDCNYVKILDFGISKFDAAITGVEGLTIEGTPIGTPFYMSPEQVRGQKTVDVCTDVYALGVVLYECLTKQRPFDADNLPHLVYLISQGQYLAPSALRPSLPRSLDGIVAKALALDRAERYSSAVELSQAVARLRQSLAPPSLELGYAPLSSALPPSESRRGAPALTPGVFSSSASLGGSGTASGEKRRLYWALAGAATLTLGVVATGLGLMRNDRVVPSALVPSPVAVPPVPAGVLTPATALSSTPTVSATPVVTVVPAPSSVRTGNAVESPDAKPMPAKTPKASKSEVERKAKNRAAAAGLSEDNPFK